MAKTTVSETVRQVADVAQEQSDDIRTKMEGQALDRVNNQSLKALASAFLAGALFGVLLGRIAEGSSGRTPGSDVS